MEGGRKKKRKGRNIGKVKKKKEEKRDKRQNKKERKQEGKKEKISSNDELNSSPCEVHLIHGLQAEQAPPECFLYMCNILGTDKVTEKAFMEIEGCTV